MVVVASRTAHSSSSARQSSQSRAVGKRNGSGPLRASSSQEFQADKSCGLGRLCGEKTLTLDTCCAQHCRPAQRPPLASAAGGLTRSTAQLPMQFILFSNHERSAISLCYLNITFHRFHGQAALLGPRNRSSTTGLCIGCMLGERRPIAPFCNSLLLAWPIACV